MTVGDFIKNCARGIYDGGCNVITAQDWLEILNFKTGEISPEIGYRGEETGTITALETASAEYQLDLSSLTTIQGVKTVFLLDENGDQFEYDNWIYQKEIAVLDLDPPTSEVPDLGISGYTSYKVIWWGEIPEFTSTDTTIAIGLPKLNLLQKICVREALNRILFDHAKLDRYRVLVARMNEYSLMSMIRNYDTMIELGKRKLVDTNPIRSY